MHLLMTPFEGIPGSEFPRSNAEAGPVLNVLELVSSADSMVSSLKLDAVQEDTVFIS